MVDIDGEVVVGEEKSGGLATVGYEAQQSPITEHAEHAGDDLRAQTAEHQHNSGDKVPLSNGLQGIAKETHLLRASRGEIPLHQHTQQEQQQHAANHAPCRAEPPPGAAFFAVFGKGEGHAGTGDENKQRHDQIPAGEGAAPLRMGKLLHEPSGGRITCTPADKELQRGRPAAEQEHIKPTQGIYTGDTLRHGISGNRWHIQTKWRFLRRFAACYHAGAACGKNKRPKKPDTAGNAPLYGGAVCRAVSVMV